MPSGRITVLGEGMLELAAQADGGWALGHGGDTLNTAIHLARLGCDVGYATALGTDAFSQRLRQAWEAEGLDCAMVLGDPDREAGLYAISLDDRGERSFAYWRGQSAARALFALPGSPAMADRAADSALLHFSLISLAILPPEGREALLALAGRVRANGGRVSFDGNYRPRLWASPDEAMAARDAALAVANIGLPTLDDEMLLGGTASAEAVAEHWFGLGCTEVVVKLGADGCRLPDGSVCPPARKLQPVDTSGAGDAFDAAYLHARMAGEAPHAAALAGHALAAWTVMRRGAIPARDDAAPY